MNLAFYVLIAVGTLGLVGVAAALLVRRGPGAARAGRPAAAAALREAARRLQQDPHDASARFRLAEAAFDDQNWSEAYGHYRQLVGVLAASHGIDEFTLDLHFGQSALRLGKAEEAEKYLRIARTLREQDFEVNHQLGLLELARKDYARAAGYFLAARSREPDDVATNRYLGHCLYNAKQYPQAAEVLRRVLDFEPEDKRTQFALGRSYLALGQGEKALGIFSRLRTDPELGALSALHAGTLHLNTRRLEEAVADLQIGLRQEKVPPPVGLELKYRLAEALLQKGDTSGALRLWKEITLLEPGYKDAREKLATYRELDSNRNLRTFLLGGGPEFIALCRKLSARHFPGASTKLLNISLRKSEYVDILAQVRGAQGEELVLFRFIRSAGATGELLLRDVHARLKEVRAGRGVCVCAGSYSEQARQFVEARPIDLVDGEALPRLLREL